MNSKYDTDLSKKPSNPLARIKDLVSAMEEILSEKPEHPIVRVSVPKLIRNIKDYSHSYHYEMLDGHALHFEIQRVADNLRRKRNVGYDEALKSLVTGLFSGEYPELACFQDVFKKYNLTDIIQAAVADFSSRKNN